METLERVKSLLRNHELMMIYIGGSHLYGIADEDSDFDINVIVKNNIGYHHTFIDNVDYFIYSIEDLKKLLVFSESSQHYSKAHMDIFLNVQEAITYLNPEYTNEFQFLYDFKLEDHFKTYINEFVKYYFYIMKNSRVQFSKRLYHIHRVKAQVENYVNNGLITYDLSEEQKIRVLNFKKNYETLGFRYYPELEKDMDYLIEYLKDGDNDGVG